MGHPRLLVRKDPRNLLNQVMLMSPALSAGILQVVWVPAGVSVRAFAGVKLPSLLTVAP
jgi:hypothetical protein